MTVGDDPGRLPIKYINLKIIELYQVSFEDMKEILVVLRLITNSPNLKELQISVSYVERVEALFGECLSICFVKHLLIVFVMTNMFFYTLISIRAPQTL